MYFVISEVTSIRSGLRKRKRAESPQPTEPQITEEWVEEDKLELWEIKYIGEKQEKSKAVTTTRSTSQRINDANNSNVASPVVIQGNSKAAPVKTNEEIKDKMEQQLKLQRAAQQQKKVVEAKTTQGMYFLLFLLQFTFSNAISLT